MDFVKMLNDIKDNPELLDTFNDQCLIWWNNKDLVDLIKDIISKYFDKNSNTYNISIQFKMSLQSLIDNPKELLELINDCLKPKDIEKKQFGEVFTPMNLINEMLDKLPIEVWTNKNLKWLDPATGMGNFQIAVYLRLMDGLKDEFEDVKERKKHILENMLYMSELNKKNVLVCKQIFDINNELKINIYEGDSLKVDYDKEFGIKQFDIIIGNPPYNASGNKATGNTIWQKFVLMSFKLIKLNGYITLIHPSGWRKPISEKGKSNNLFDLMTSKNNMIYLEMHDSKDGMKTFNCGTKYDWYVINIKNNINNNTEVIDEKKSKHLLNLKNYSFLPNSNIELFNKIYCKNPDITNILYSRSSYGSDKKWVSKLKNENFKYTVIHSTTKSGCRYLYSNTNNNGFYGIKKVIFGDSGINEPIIDNTGDLLLSEHAMAIPIINNNEKIIYECIKSDKFKDFIKSCMWSNFQIDWRLFTYLKKNFYELLDFKENNITNYETKSDENIVIPKISKNKTTTKTSRVIDSNENKDVVELSDDNIIPKVAKKKITTKKIEIDMDIKKEEIKFDTTDENVKLPKDKSKDTKQIIDNKIKNNEPTIIKDGRKKYYLIGTKLYKVKRDKSQGKLFCSYIDGKIIE
jgi:hypothetical protein